MSAENPYAPPQAAVADIPAGEARPALWNPNAAASWSLLFSPIFGSWLHMRNWQAMGDDAKAATSRRWVLGSTIFFIALVLLTALLPESQVVDGLSRLAGFALLLAWYYSIGKSQNALVLARYGKDYPRKGWAKPLGAAVVLFIGFIALAGLLGFAIGMLADAG